MKWFLGMERQLVTRPLSITDPLARGLLAHPWGYECTFRCRRRNETWRGSYDFVKRMPRYTESEAKKRAQIRGQGRARSAAIRRQFNGHP